MRSLDRRERYLAVVTGTVVIIGLIYVQVIEPLVDIWISAYQAAVQAEKRLNTLQQLNSQKGEIEREYAQLAGISETENSAEKAVANLLEKVESLGRASGLQVTGLRPVGKSLADRVSVELTAKGEPNNFLQFLDQIQRPENLLCTEKVSLTVGRSAPKLSLTVLLTKLAIPRQLRES